MGNAVRKRRVQTSAEVKRRYRRGRWLRTSKAPPRTVPMEVEEVQKGHEDVKEDDPVDNSEMERKSKIIASEERKSSKSSVIIQGSSSSIVANKRISISRDTSSYQGILPKRKKQDRGKLTVVLDMDETLIHSKFQSQSNSYRQEEKRKTATRKGDITFDLSLGPGSGAKERVEVFKRPGLDKFLDEAAKHFEVVLFTAAIPIYAKPVLDRIDPKKRLKHRLFRDSTVTFEGQPYVKDISLLGRDLARTVLVDNNPAAMLACPDNAIPILSFYDSSKGKLSIANIGAVHRLSLYAKSRSGT